MYYSITLITVTTTTIQVKEDTKKTLQSMKLHPRETFEEVIERLIEDLSELNSETRREIEEARREIEKGKFVTHKQLKKNLDL